MIDFNKIVSCYGKDVAFKKGWEAFLKGDCPRSAPKAYIFKREETEFIKGWITAWKRYGNIFPDTEHHVTSLIHHGWNIR